MFQRLYELGALLPLDRYRSWELLNQGMRPHYDRGFAICFDAAGSYAGVRTIMGSRGVAGRGVVYLPGPSSNSAPLVPCSLLSGQMKTKVLYLFQSARDVGLAEAMPDRWRHWLEAVDWEDNQLVEAVVRDIATSRKEAGVGMKLANGRIRSGYMFPAWYENGEIRPLYELDAAKKTMCRKVAEIWRRDGTRNGSCAVCGQRAEVFGNYARLKCYSLDKPGLIAGGFDRKRSHHNFPVCFSCAVRLDHTIGYVEERLTGTMAGQRYMILPFSSADTMVRELMRQELEERPQRFSISPHCDLIAGHEEEFLSFIQEENLRDHLAFSLVFFQKKNAEWKITAEVQQILPGRMRSVQQARKRIAADRVLALDLGNSERPLEITADTFRMFAGTGKNSGRTTRLWLAAVFEGRSMGREIFLGQIVHRLLDLVRREPKKEPKKIADHLRQAWGLFLFARHVNLIPGGQKEMDTITFPDTPFGRYMAEHEDFFGRPEIMVAFLTGCYASTVCQVQRKERGSDPFARKFLGRLLGRDHLRRLYREGHDKLARYGRLGYVAASLEPDLAQAWVLCGDRWRISDEEASFAFAVGFSLAGRIRRLAADTAGDEATDTLEEDKEESR